jgi:hypothetical protein
MAWGHRLGMNLAPRLLCALLSFALAAPCLARLGETEAECEERYGKPVPYEDPIKQRPHIPGQAAPAEAPEKQLLYNTDKAEILVGLIDGRAASIQYKFRGSEDSEPAPLEGPNLKALLDANAPDVSWLYMPDHPYTLDPKVEQPASPGDKWQLRGTLISTDGQLYAFFMVSPPTLVICRTSLRPTFQLDQAAPVDLEGL